MPQGILFSKSQAARIGATVKDYERRTPSGQRGQSSSSSPSPSFWIELTAEGTGDDKGWYSWKKVYPDPNTSDGWIDADPATADSLNARDMNGTRGLMAGISNRFLATFIGYDDDGLPAYMFDASDCLLVKLSTDGGDAGDEDTDCSLTYKLKNRKDDTVLEEYVEVPTQREEKLTYKPATYGLRFYVDDTPKVIPLDEIPDPGECGDEDEGEDGP